MSHPTIEQLVKENAELKKQLQEFQNRVGREHEEKKTQPLEKWNDDETLSIIVIGASGDLAKKKTYPALFSLFVNNLIPSHAIIAGFSRTEISHEKFRSNLKQSLKSPSPEKLEAFLSRVFYFQGQYDSFESFSHLSSELDKLERATSKAKTLVANRVFYLAIPPSIFTPVARAIRHSACSPSGWVRLVVEKPFGRDSVTSKELSSQLALLFSEDQLYRIDHYLGKEMVQNLMVLRFANLVFEPLWNRNYIKNVTITFKEDIGTQGRGGYFDEFGIIRDVMQNHLLQIFALVAMEPPVSLNAEDVRDEKVKLLRCVKPIIREEIVTGQYLADPKGKEPGYLEDPTVPKGSVTPTFATAILHIHNQRWEGTPFILKCGKALDERKAEIRIQFYPVHNNVFVGTPVDGNPNELVIRVQPNEAVYLKMFSKKPGLTTEVALSELDLTYKSRFELNTPLPDAYERLIYDVVRGDHNLFVRDDELEAAWAIFTPILHKIESEKIAPEKYTFGSRGPSSSDELVSKFGFVRTKGYVWKPSL
jgi:glucose-6-phosphate 1-dehydrogenase